MKRLPLTVVDRALPAPLFRALTRGVAAVGDERLESTYQTTFWYDFDEPARCIPEQVITALRPSIPRLKELVGVEWWLSRMSTHDVQVDFHVDRDERLALATGKIVNPRVSSVLFLNRVTGGLLAVTWQKPNDQNPSLAPDAPEFDFVRPEPNRLAVFDGRMTHGVLDARNQIPERRLRGPGELRLTLVMNWWHRRPRETPAWAETELYRALKVKAGRARSPRAGP